MHIGSFYHGDIIAAFQRHVPGSYVRDYRDRGGFITICRNYRDLLWHDQTTTRKVYRQAPAITLFNLPRGNITRRTLYHGLKLHRPGWLQEFERAGRHLTRLQKRLITQSLHVNQVFPDVTA